MTKAGKHRELVAAEIMKSKEAVQRTLTAIKTFTDPFAITEKDRLYNITFGAPVSPEVKIDVLRADTAGKEAKKAFISNRFQNWWSEITFFEPIMRQMQSKSPPHRESSFSTVSRATWPSCFSSSHSFWRNLSTHAVLPHACSSQSRHP